MQQGTRNTGRGMQSGCSTGGKGGGVGVGNGVGPLPPPCSLHTPLRAALCTCSMYEYSHSLAKSGHMV